MKKLVTVLILVTLVHFSFAQKDTTALKSSILTQLPSSSNLSADDFREAFYELIRNSVLNVDGKVDSTWVSDYLISVGSSDTYYNKPESDSVAIAKADSLNNIVIPNAKTDDYTFELSDAGKLITMTAATTKTITIPLNAAVAFPVNTRIDIAGLGAGDVEIATSGTINSASSQTTIGAQFGVVTIIKQSTDTWLLFGSLK
jgi:hypothetical protein